MGATRSRPEDTELGEAAAGEEDRVSPALTRREESVSIAAEPTSAAVSEGLKPESAVGLSEVEPESPVSLTWSNTVVRTTPVWVDSTASSWDSGPVVSDSEIGDDDDASSVRSAKNCDSPRLVPKSAVALSTSGGVQLAVSTSPADECNPDRDAVNRSEKDALVAPPVVTKLVVTRKDRGVELMTSPSSPDAVTAVCKALSIGVADVITDAVAVGVTSARRCVVSGMSSRVDRSLAMDEAEVASTDDCEVSEIVEKCA